MREYGLLRRMTFSNLIVLFFACWPLFWNLWVVFRPTAYFIGSSVPVYVLVILALMQVIYVREVKLDFSLIWLVFFLSVMPSIVIGNKSVFISNILVCISCYLLCITLSKRNINLDMVLKAIHICGIIVSASVILNAVYRGYPDFINKLYTDEAIVQLLTRKSSFKGCYTGMLPYPASSGCFIISGAAAYCCRQLRRKWKFRQWLTLGGYLLAFLLIQKRGFIIDMAVTFMAIWIIHKSQDGFKGLNFNKLIKRLILVIILLATLIFAYERIPLFRDNVDSIIGRFTAEDTTISGRTYLYTLAFEEFKSSPLVGIGWGRYRILTRGIFASGNDATYQVHNVYLQLLCETGIIGLAGFLTAAIGTLLNTIKSYRRMLKKGFDVRKRRFLLFALYQQLMFLAYAMSGNDLYDYNFLGMYFIGILISYLYAEEKICINIK